MIIDLVAYGVVGFVFLAAVLLEGRQDESTLTDAERAARAAREDGPSFDDVLSMVAVDALRIGETFARHKAEAVHALEAATA